MLTHTHYWLATYALKNSTLIKEKSHQLCLVPLFLSCFWQNLGQRKWAAPPGDRPFWVIYACAPFARCFRPQRPPGRHVGFLMRSQAPCTLDATHNATRKNGARSHFVACCVMHCSLPAVCTVATIGVACPDLLRFSRRVWCAWGLIQDGHPGLRPRQFP